MYMPRSSISTQLSVEVGQTITMDCPIAVGALRELYSFIGREGFQTVDTTALETQYSVDPLNKSLTIASVQLDNNGTYYCDVTVSVPGVNPYFVPEEYTKITPLCYRYASFRNLFRWYIATGSWLAKRKYFY